ncbi:MAG: hypothetical protein HY593_00260 [Candidatus Omnitrophica bacterium]|nr:hypothetical protein [Elusimicrobiota bacterium]MBI4352334.1 hypothetical protein [Candidatus Omnitrophota bacterium]
MTKVSMGMVLAGSFFFSSVLSGCSVGMALSGKEQKDVSVLAPGAPRDTVIAHLGPPQTSVTGPDGLLIDTWDVVKGNNPSAGRAIVHAGMDFLTLGLWEIAGTPIELAAGQEAHTIYTITYDKENKIKNLSASDRVVAGSPPTKEEKAAKGTLPTPKNKSKGGF